MEEKRKSEKMNQAIDLVHKRFGKNSLLHASSLLENSTIKDRNQKIGGHHE